MLAETHFASGKKLHRFGWALDLCMPAVEMQRQRLFVHVFIVQPFRVMIFHIPTQAADVISIWIGSGHWHLAVWVFRSLKLAEAG